MIARESAAPGAPLTSADAMAGPPAGEPVAYYTYAIARRKSAGPAAPLGASGVDPRFPVYALARGDLLAVVSAVPLAEFRPEALKARLQDGEWVRALALAHQRVLAGLLEEHVVLPLQFCTLYNSADRVLEMLAANQAALAAALDRLAGATEWGVKIFCDRRQLIEWAKTSSEQLRPLSERIGRVAEGASYLLRRKLEHMAGQLAESLERGHAQECHLRLSGRARAAASHPPQAPDAHGQPGEMILNGSYLVADRDQERFEAELARLQEQLDPLGFRCELTGPWPPYSFAVIEGDA